MQPRLDFRDLPLRSALVTALAVCLSLFCVAAFAGEAPVRIGVLAKRGAEKTLARWQLTADYLGERIAGHRFELVPLDFDEIHLAVRQRRIDFVLANPAFYVELESLYGVNRIATLRNLHRPGEAYSRFGGVIFVRADRQELREVKDLKGRRLAAVDPRSFGGWLMAWRELQRLGIDPQRDLAGLEFAGTHDAVVYAVLEGRVDAGTVRTDTLERMAAEGRIDMDTLFVVGQRNDGEFPFLRSTPLYPEWPFAVVRGVSERLAVQVAVALLEMAPDSVAARTGESAGWTIPLNYQPVHDCLRALRVGPYERLNRVPLAEVIAQYWRWILGSAAVLMLVLATTGYVVQLNRRLTSRQREVQQLNATLEERVSERTERVRDLLSKEQYLRGILKTVADINQILITADDLPDLLKGCCDRLVGHRDYRFAWIGLVQDGRLKLAGRSYGVGGKVLQRLAGAISGGGFGLDEPVARAVAENRPLVINDLHGAEEGGPWCDLFPEPDLCSVVALPLRKDVFTGPFGQLCVFSGRPEGFEPEETSMLEELAGDIGFAVNAFRQQEIADGLQQERISNYEETIVSMIDMIEQRDTYTAGHTRRVARYCELIAAGMELPAEEIEKLKRAAILHDIGKIATPDSVLLKPDRLQGLELDLIKEHVVAGHQMLAKIEMYKDLAEIMRSHHERWDGGGYPGGLKGEAIPLMSRIMAVADAFDAMTTNRIYKPRKEVPAALEEMRALAGSQFDPGVVTVAVEVLKGVEPSELITQLPQTELEKERFAYFFNDQLTGVYNAEYLQFVLRSGHVRDFRQAHLVSLIGFSHYNAERGWKQGDTLLRDFAARLRELAGEDPVCRVFGDDFVLLTREPLALDRDALAGDAPLRDTRVGVELRCFELDSETGVEGLKALL